MPEGLVVYHIKVRQADKIKYRTRLGFFQSRSGAMKQLGQIKKIYPRAWLDTTKKYDLSIREKWFGNKTVKPSKTFANTSVLLTGKETEELMEKARRLVAEQKYAEAIKVYTKVLSRGDRKLRMDAQEYLGVTREKNGQYAHAKAEYQEYLRKYPTSDGAERVKMRLDNMLLANAKPRHKLANKKFKTKTEWINYGYFTEFYRKDTFSQNGVENERSSLSTALGFFSRRKSDSSDIKLELTGSHLHDLDNEDKNRKRLNSFFIDYSNRPKSTSFRLGRQSHTRSGVLGRMDGLWADYQFDSQWKFNVVAGYPVNLFETNRIDDTKKFYGYSLDIGPFNKYWDFNLFSIEQEVSGLQDRKAVGGEIRYVSPKGVFFTLVDYDTYFEGLNKVYVISNIYFKSGASLNMTYDKGKSPYLLSTNALQGQPFSSIEEMRNNFTEQEIKQIAIDRTSEVTTYTINGTIPLSKKINLNMDVTMSNLSGTPSSAGITGTDPTGDEYFYGAQLIGIGVFGKNDTLVMGVRYSDTHSYERTAYTLSERILWNNTWRSKFGIYYDTTDKTNGAHVKTTRPSIGIDYIHSRSLRLEAEIQHSQSTESGDTLPSETEGTFFSAGLIYDF
ncbi:MAG: tetratricopeptide repeat protein [Gammaproteobacteria bacterium]|nr:tetratricopeptide repeat protein [Gammaproteobacteria bacterium]